MIIKLVLLFLHLYSIQSFAQTDSWIRINQLGYLPNTPKVAVLISKKDIDVKEFLIRDAYTEKIIYTSNEIQSFGNAWNFNSNFRLDFSSLKNEGIYFIECNDVRSPYFKIAKNVYNGTADFLLKYMRQQRCGYNPFLKDSCHTKDGFIIYLPERDSDYIDVKGGWHDASDYLQYVTTSANAVYQMLFAYQQNPKAFTDKFDANGNEGSNNISDILDEAKWGIDWLLKMNPEKDLMFNQIADDRDHMGFRLPNEDTISYGKGLERPVYFATGKPQGIFKYQNRSTGLASTAGKFASAFALASDLLKNYYPELSVTLLQKSIEAFELGKKYPGVCQTAPCRAPYFYEEENFKDDMELAASQLFLVTKNNSFLKDGITFGKEEKIIPWMGADTAKHYEWYPFVNLGHYLLAKENTNDDKKIFISYIKEGIEKVVNRGKNNPFNIGIPFIWCS
ncbi:MAG TPA: glycoside hydrolase family 9 protein, partial [Ignavibacteriaceae bacterium]